MLRTLSTYLFIKRRLTPALAGEIAQSGVGAIEIFCSRSHFDYRSAEAARELAAAMADHGLIVHAVHAPTERAQNPSRESGFPLSISDPERVRRLEAVDEVKRALDLAEHFPFRWLVQHMGSSRDGADPRRVDAAFNSLEHLHLFAKQRGVTIALENTPAELGTPAHLRQFIAETRMNELRFCFDAGHAHMADGIAASLEAMRDLVVTTHIHDNHGIKDEHLPPGEGTIDWKQALAALAAPSPVPLVLELKEQPAQAEPAPASVALEMARAAFETIEREMEAIGRGAEAVKEPF